MCKVAELKNIERHKMLLLNKIIVVSRDRPTMLLHKANVHVKPTSAYSFLMN